MNFKLIKNIVLVLFIGLIYLSSSVRIACAGYTPGTNPLLDGVDDRINSTMPYDDGVTKWSDEGKRRAEEEAKKKKAEEDAQKKKDGVPESDYLKKTEDPLKSILPTTSSKTACEGDYKPANLDAGTTPDSAGLFSPEIMTKMQAFMRQIYKELSKVFMIGHSLLCYSQKVAYLCIGVWGKCFAKLANMNLFVSGMLIYIVAVLMTMSIGMYFVDISFKLGFAMLFMPISIALWPFPPTKNKFQENLSIIIRNGMLFTLVAIGVTFAVTLISNSLLDTGDGRDGWEAFWKAIADKKTEILIDNFAFDRMHFLVVAFALIFGFKILASSVNDYLDYFFSDSVFGSESPMHHMGTQAVGLVAANTIKPAASFVGDVAKTQTGRAIAGLGGGIAALGSKEGRAQLAGGVKKFASAVANPRRTYNNAMGKLGEKTNQAVQGMGSLVKGAANVGLLFSLTKDSTRREREKRWDDKIDKAFKKAGNWAENKVAHGGGQLQNAAADAAAAGINLYNKQVLGKNNPNDIVTRDDVKGAINQSLDSVKDDLKAAGKGIKTGARNMAAGAAAAVYNTGQMIAGNPENLKTGDDIVEDLQDFKDDVLDTVDKLSKTKAGQETISAWKNADKAPVTLQPSAILSTSLKLAKGTVGAPFKITGGTIKGAYKGIKKIHQEGFRQTYRSVKQLAQANYASLKLRAADTLLNAKELKDNLSTAEGRKVILQNTGRVVLRTVARTVKGTGQDIKHAAEGTASIFGNVLKDFGQSLQNNKPADGQSKHKWTTWQDMHDDEQRNKEEAQKNRDYFKSINTYDD